MSEKFKELDESIFKASEFIEYTLNHLCKDIGPGWKIEMESFYAETDQGVSSYSGPRITVTRGK